MERGLSGKWEARRIPLARKGLTPPTPNKGAPFYTDQLPGRAARPGGKFFYAATPMAVRRPATLLLALLPIAPAAQDDRSDLRRAIRGHDREAALALIRDLIERDGRQAADDLLHGLCTAYDEERRIRRELEKMRLKDRRLHIAYQRARDEVAREELLGQMKQLKDGIQTLEVALFPVQEIGDRIIEGLVELSREEALEYLLERAAASPDWFIRAWLARTLGGHPRISFEKATRILTARLQEEEVPAVRVQLIEALRMRRDKRAEVQQALYRILENDPWPVVSAAVEFLSDIADPAAVPHLIRALGRFDGRLRAEIHGLLVRLTGVRRSPDPGAWRTWWEQHGAAFLKGDYVPPPAGRSEPVPETRLFGMPVRSRNLLIVLDRSESMGEKVGPEQDMPGWKDGRPRPRKLDLAVARIKKLLEDLPRGTRFNLLAYEETVRLFAEAPVELEPATRERARAFLDSLTPVGGTNVYAAIGHVRSLIQKPDGRLRPGAMDSVYWISDGLPSSGMVRDPGRLVRRFARVARLSRVQFHTIYTGPPKGPGRAFLQQIARVGSGRFIEAR